MDPAVSVEIMRLVRNAFDAGPATNIVLSVTNVSNDVRTVVLVRIVRLCA